MKPFRWRVPRRLAWFLLLALALSVSAVAVLGYLAYRQSQEILRTEYSVRLGSLAVERQQTLSLILRQCEKALVSLSHDASIVKLARSGSRGIAVAQSTLTSVQKHSKFLGLFLADPDNTRQVVTGVFQRGSPAQWTSDVKRALEGSFVRLEVGDDGKPIFLVGTPIENASDSSHPYAVLLGLADISEFNELFENRAALGSTGESFITDRHGRPLLGLRYPPPTGKVQSIYAINARPMKACLAGANSSFTIEPDYLNVLTVMAYRTLPEIGGGCLMVHIRAEEAFSSTRLLQARLFSLIGLVIFAVVVILLLVGNKVFRIVEQEGLKQELAARREAERLQSLQLSMSQILAEADTVEQSMSKLLAVVCEGMGWDFGEFWGREQRSNLLRCMAIWHAPSVQLDEAAALNRTITLPLNATDPLSATGSPTWLPEMMRESSIVSDAVAVQAGMRCKACVPVQSGGQVLAVMVFFSREPRQPDGSLLHLLADLGIKFGQFIERNRAAEELRHSEESVRSVLDSAFEAVVVMDEEGRITEWNPSAERLFGWRREEAQGRTLSGTMIPSRLRDTRDRDMQPLLTAAGLNQRIELVALRRDGSEFPVELSVSRIRTGGSYMFSAFITDITERRRRERRLSLENAVARILVDSPTLDAAIPLVLRSICESLEWEFGAFWAVDERFGVIHCNTTWHSGSDAMTQFAALSSQITFPAGVGLPGRVFASGEPFWISDVVQDPNFPRAQAAEQLGLHGAFAFPIRRMGKVLGVMEFFSRKIQRQDEDLLQMLSAIGSLIALVIESKQTNKPLFGEVAHDFNNLLTVITGYSEYLLNRLTDQRDPLGLEIQRVKNAGDIAAFLTRQFLSFNRRQPGHPGVLDLNAVVSEMEKTLKLVVGEKIDLVTVLRSGLGHVKADPGQIEKIVMNLVLHTRDAMPNGGSLTIETANVELDEIFARFHQESSPGSYVMLAVTGTGGAVDVGTPTRSEQFFTAPLEGDERGMGLANVYSIVKNHGGVISVSNNGTESTAIKIYLPRLETPSRAEELV